MNQVCYISFLSHIVTECSGDTNNTQILMKSRNIRRAEKEKDGATTE